MRRLISTALWPTIAKLGLRAVKRGAIAYVSSDRYLKFSDGDILVCDASPSAIRAGQTSAPVLQRAVNRGAMVYSLPGLHAKVLLLDGTAVIGSANASISSANLIEAAWITDEPKAVSMAQSFVQQLATDDRRLTQRHLSALSRIEVKRAGFPQALPAGGVHLRQSHRSWIIGSTEMVNDPPEDQNRVESHAEKLAQNLSNPRSTVDWVRWTGRSRYHNEAKKDDWIIQMWKPHGRKLPQSIYARMPLLKPLKFESVTYFFYEKFPNAEKTALSWKAFKDLSKRAGIGRRIAPGSQFEITEKQADALIALWSK